MKKRLFFFTLNSLSTAPYPEVALPALARDGWEITIAGRGATRSVYRSSLPFACKEIIDLPGEPRSARLESAVAKALWRARFGPYDVLYLNSLMAAVRGAVHLAGPRLGKRIVYHNPDYYCPIHHPWYSRLEGRFCRKADLYINNEFHRGYITQVLYRARCPVLTAPPNVPAAWPVAAKSAEKRSQMSGGRADAFVLMLHGGWGPLRMVEELCAGLALLPERFRLVMTGRGQTRDQADAELERLGLAQRVVRLPVLGFNEMLEYSVNADAGVLVYRNNDLGNFFTAPGRLTEYLTCGLPVLGSDHTGIENIIMKYDLGVTTNARVPKGIAASIERLASQASAGRYPAIRMRQVFREHLAYDHWEPVVVRAMNEMLEGRKFPAFRGPPYPWLPNP